MAVTLISFGYRHGAPTGCNRLVDMRDLRNPHKLASLRDLTGLDNAVQEYVSNDPKFDGKKIEALRGTTLNSVLGIGCFGGRHRSVAMVEILAKELRQNGRVVVVEHRELGVTG